MCALFLFACTPAEQTSENEHTSDKIDLPTPSSQQTPAPLLTLNELLNAEDVKTVLAEAAQQQDRKLLLQWQEILLAAAEEVDLPASDIKLLSGQQGLVFLEFQGMKTNYQRAFETAFFEFQDLDKVYEQYPAFKDMHKQSKELVKQRDALVDKVATQLNEKGYEGDAVAEAKRQWQNYMQTQQKKTSVISTTTP